MASNPWPTLTLIVSLEAIFLSTFVMIGQNRQVAFQQAKAKSRLHRAGAGAQNQHRADPGDPQAHYRAAQAGDRRPRPVTSSPPEGWRTGGHLGSGLDGRQLKRPSPVARHPQGA
jgi:hypothetical protein